MHEALSSYLDAEFAHSIGAYDGALEVLPRSPSDQMAAGDRMLVAVSREAREFNRAMREHRFCAVGPDHRDPGGGPVLRIPAPPRLATVDPDGARAEHWQETERTVLSYYATLIKTLDESRTPSGRHRALQRALLLGVEVADRPARTRALRHRYERRQARLLRVLPERQVSSRGDDDSGLFYYGSLSGETARPVAAVLDAAAEAHWLTRQVEHLRSGSVGHVLTRVAEGSSAGDATLLQRSIALNTFVFSISRAMPWIFASVQEREHIRDNLEFAGEEFDRESIWIARRFAFLAIYRRGRAFGLNGEHSRAYNDYWKLQYMVRRTKQVGKSLPEHALLLMDILDALAEYRIAELFRADHDSRQALVHLCRTLARLESLRAAPDPDAAQIDARAIAIRSFLPNARWSVTLALSKGKTFYEQGQIKRACKWYLRAWQGLDALAISSGFPRLMTALGSAHLASALEWLMEVRYEPDFDKQTLLDRVRPTIEHLGTPQRLLEAVPASLHAFAADILDRLGHCFMIMRLDDDDRLAETCLQLSLALDKWNLLARSDLRQIEARVKKRVVTLPPDLPDALDCWPSGGSVVEQAIRVAEYHTRERVTAKLVAHGETEGPDQRDQVISLKLLDHFLTHTDSMHVRSGLVYQHLAPRTNSHEALDDQPGIELVCLRRYGSTSPFMARPAAVHANGGGYLLRLLGAPDPIHILVDPGEGVVANLYRTGFRITDIDYIFVTHDHPDHMAGLDPVLALLREYDEMTGEDRPVKMYGNTSVVNRYALVPEKGQREFINLSELDDGIPVGDNLVHVSTIETGHTDIGQGQALGFTLSYEVAGSRVASLTFMSDADRKTLGARWDRALDADIVVAHISDASVGELRELAFRPSHTAPDAGSWSAFDEMIDRLSDRNGDAKKAYEHLTHALGLRGPKPDPGTPHRGIFEAGYLADLETAKHLMLGGLLEVADTIHSRATGDDGRVIVVGEFKEQLGPFRGKIAHHLTSHAFDKSPHVALTADIGLRIRVADGRITVHCGTCALNNDRSPEDCYHAPQDIRERCVKGDAEGMAWSCKWHDPGYDARARFSERTPGYDIFRPGGQFDG